MQIAMCCLTCRTPNLRGCRVRPVGRMCSSSAKVASDGHISGLYMASCGVRTGRRSLTWPCVERNLGRAASMPAEQTERLEPDSNHGHAQVIQTAVKGRV